MNQYVDVALGSLRFPCLVCGRPAFTIRGCCAQCDPVTHQDRQEQMAAYDMARAAYLRETGQEPLRDWYAFEDWLAKP